MSGIRPVPPPPIAYEPPTIEQLAEQGRAHLARLQTRAAAADRLHALVEELHLEMPTDDLRQIVEGEAARLRGLGAGPPRRNGARR